jgi:cytidylate kinase
MATITLSRQYGSGGDEIARRISEITGYRYFDKVLMTQLAHDEGLAEGEIVDYSEDNPNVRNFWKHLFSSGVVSEARVWEEDDSGVHRESIRELNETSSLVLMQSTIQAAYRHGNVIIVGRGGQALLLDKPDVFHVRIEASLEARVRRVQEQTNLELTAAQRTVQQHDQAASDYLSRFYLINGSDPLLYHLVINTGKMPLESAAQLIASVVAPASGMAMTFT